MKNNKKILLTTIGIAILVVLVSGVTFAFFNYTRTGVNNTIRVGRISFVTRQTSTINLANVFPIDSEDVDTDTDNVDEVVIEIEGDTDYVDGIEYLVSSVDSNIYTSSGVLVPISLDITVDGLGTEKANYYTARESKNANIYKRLVGGSLVGDGMLLVGYINKNTTNGVAEGVNGSITIKAYFDKDKILISDTYDGTESLDMGTPNNQADGKTVITTTEWNALQSSGISFKVKIEANEGIWVKESLYDVLRTKNINTTTGNPIKDNEQSEYVTASTGINFGEISSDTNGKGLYMKSDTVNSSYPILYYRGDIDDNNVFFAGICWKAMHTTDTGGVKLIYNGENNSSSTNVLLQSDNYINVSYNTAFEFDQTDNTWNIEITSEFYPSISFTVPDGNNYSLDVIGTTGSSTGGMIYIYKNGTQVYTGSGGGGQPLSSTYNFGALLSTDIIKFQFYGRGTENSPITFKLKMTKNNVPLEKSSYTLSGNEYTFDSNTGKWSSSVEPNKEALISFSVDIPSYYYIDYTNPNEGSFNIYKTGEKVTTSTGTSRTSDIFLSPSDKVVISYTQNNPNANATVEFSLTRKNQESINCNQDNYQKTSLYRHMNYNSASDSLAYVGYMYGSVYNTSSKYVSNDDMIYGTGFEYTNGVYKLTGTGVGLADGRHYTCFTTSDTCNGSMSGKVYYVHYKYGKNDYYYITLQNGHDVDYAINSMQNNTNDSLIKSTIESWFKNRLNSYVNSIEDTIYCNDRSWNNEGTPFFIKNGWMSNENYYGTIYFSSYGRLNFSYQPDINCKQRNDAFTVKNGSGNKALKYPIGLLTSDELMLAGEKYNQAAYSYLYTSNYMWTMTPVYYTSTLDLIRYGSGITPSLSATNNLDIRPVISLKLGTVVSSGTGTASNPYVIE